MPVVGDFLNAEKTLKRKGTRQAKVHVMNDVTRQFHGLSGQSVKGKIVIVDITLAAQAILTPQKTELDFCA